MTSLKWKFLIIFLAIFSLSCQAVSLIKHAGYLSRGDLTPTPTIPQAIGTPSPEVSLIATSTPLITTPQIPTATPTITVTPSAFQVKIFNELWQIVRDEYLYPDFNELNWDAIYLEYSARIGAGLYPEEFYRTMNEMISRLGDDHSFFISPSQVVEEEAQFSGLHDYVGVGVLVSAVPDRNKAVILVTIPGGPVDQAGLQPRDSILAVDGEPILDEDGFLRDIIRGPEGTDVVLTVQSPGQELEQITLTRNQISSSVPVPYQVLTTATNKRIGYIFMVTFADYTVDSQIGEALREMTAEGQLDGLILDNRFNQGGINTVLQSALSYFTNGELGYFISRFEERPFRVEGQNIGDSQTIPLVVLISAETESYGEVFAGILKDTQRAYLIGVPTAGNIETLWGYDFEDGSRAWIAYETFRPYHNPEDDWEITGVSPHQVVRSDWSEVTLEGDAVVQSALDYLDLSE